jgi:hypothetical protein
VTLSYHAAVLEAERIIRRRRPPRWREAAVQAAILTWYVGLIVGAILMVGHHTVNEARALYGRPPWRRY